MADPINKIEENISNKWWKGFMWGFLIAIGLFFGALKIFPMWFESILKKDYVTIDKYESVKDFKKDSTQKNNSPKNSNTQIGDSNSNIQN